MHKYTKIKNTKCAKMMFGSLSVKHHAIEIGPTYRNNGENCVTLHDIGIV